MSQAALSRKLIGHQLDESTVTPRQKRVWALAATGIGLDGYDLFIMSAALPLIMADFGQTSAWMSALFAGAAVLGAVPGALLSGILSDKYGRRNILRIDVALFGVTAILCAIAWNPAALIVFRFFQGFAVGAEYPISASMVAEVTRQIEAAKSVDETEPKEGSIKELFRPTYRARTALTAVPWFIMDIALYGIGIFTPIILATFIHTSSANSPNSFLAGDLKATATAAVADIFLVIGFIINIYSVERAGRIRLQILGFIGMAVGLTIVAFTGDSTTSTVWVILGFVIFNLMVNIGPNATTYLLPAEVFPTRLRSTGHGYAAACGKVGATIGVFFLPSAIAAFGLGNTMIAIAIFCLVGAVITLMFRIETKGMALE